MFDKKRALGILSLIFFTTTFGVAAAENYARGVLHEDQIIVENLGEFVVLKRENIQLLLCHSASLRVEGRHQVYRKCYHIKNEALDRVISWPNASARNEAQVSEALVATIRGEHLNVMALQDRISTLEDELAKFKVGFAIEFAERMDSIESKLLMALANTDQETKSGGFEVNSHGFHTS